MKDPRLGATDYWLAVAIAVVVVAGLLYTTADGLDVATLDSPHYLVMAESIADGRGPEIPFGDAWRPLDLGEAGTSLRHFPTGYSQLGSLPIRAGLDSVQSFRLLNSLMLGVLAGAWFLLARRFRIHKLASLAIAGVATAIVGVYALRPHSELFYALILTAVLWLMWRWANTRSIAPLVVASALAGLSIFVRFIGLSLVGAILLTVWFLARGGERKKAGGIAVALGLAPALLITLLDSGGIPRQLVWHPMSLFDFRRLGEAVAWWVVPPQIGRDLSLIIGLAVVVAAVTLVWRAGPSRPSPEDWVMGTLSALGHIAMITVSGFLFDANDAFTVRLMMPSALSVLFVLTTMGGRWISEAEDPGSSRAVRVLAGVLGLATLSSVLVFGGEALDVRSGELGFASDSHINSVVSEYARNHPDVAIFSNTPDGMWVVGRPGVWALPAPYNEMTLLDNADFDVEFGFMAEKLLNEGGVVAVYHGHREDLMTPEMIDFASCLVVSDDIGEIRAHPAHPDC